MNLFLYGFFWGMLAAGLIIGAGMVRSFRKWHPPYACDTCGWHDKGFTTSDACPECGNFTLKNRT